MSATSISSTLACAAIGLALGIATGAGAFSRVLSSAKTSAITLNGSDHLRHVGASDAARFASDDAAISAVFSAWQLKNSLHRAASLTATLDGLDASQLAQMVERVAGFGDWEMQELLAVLVKQWALQDPGAAAAWARPSIERTFAGASKNSDWSVVSTWCAADPESAIALAMERPGALASQNLIGYAIRAQAENDPAGQLDRMAELPNGNLRDAAIATALNEWGKTDPAAALGRLDSLPEGARRDETMGGILSSWARKVPAAALAELGQRIEDGELGRGRGRLEEIISGAASVDPAGALEWAEKLPADLRDDARILAAAGWAQKDPMTALDWATNNGLALDQNSFLNGNSWGRDNILSAALNADPEKTVDWLRRLPAGADRDRLLGQTIYRINPTTAREVFAEMSEDSRVRASGSIGYRMAQLGQDEAIAWTKEESSPSVRRNVISGVVASLGRQSPRELDAVLAEYPSGSDRDAALRGAVQGMWGEKPNDALQYAQRVSDPVVREQTFRSLATGWLYQDMPAARAWISSTNELAPDVKAMLIRSATENKLQ